MLDMAPFSRHERIALSFSGGKDSMACLYMLRDELPRIHVYHVDTGDFLPETVEVVERVRAMCPNFTTIETGVAGWISENGLPTDLLPFSSHPLGRAIGQERVRLSARYDCCFANVMWPLLERIRADGMTLLIRGTKTADMPHMPVVDGDVMVGVEFCYPIQGWSDQEVLDYLRQVGAPISRVYDYAKSSLDCATCPAWWTDKRAAYLRRNHPALHETYRQRLGVILEELRPSMAALLGEVSSG